MAQAQTKSKSEPTVETIAEPKIWRAIVDAVNTVAHDEAVFEFDTDGLRIRTKDAANVALVRQFIAADDFEHYDVESPHASGMNTQKFEDLLKAVDDDLIEFGWDWDVYKWDFHADGVNGKISGITPDSVNGSPVDVPPVKEEYEYSVDVTLPVDRFKKASKVVDMASDHATFRMGGDKGVFVISGKGDTDEYTVDVHEDDAFEWREDAPTAIAETVQSNDYIQEVVSLLDEDTVRFVNGPELPYHLWTTRAGCIDTKIMQAPRIVSE